MAVTPPTHTTTPHEDTVLRSSAYDNIGALVGLLECFRDNASAKNTPGVPAEFRATE